MISVTEEIIVRSIRKVATPEEQGILNKWLREEEKNIAYYCQLEEIWNSGESLPEKAIYNSWQMLAREIDMRPKEIQSFIIPVKKRKNGWLRYVAAIFTGVLLASVAWMTLSDILKEPREHISVQNVLYNKTGVQLVVLPDSSQVWMNEDTRITYPEEFTGEKRLVVLEGKAYFDIRKNAEIPFVVQIGDVEIEVTGTEFFVESALEEESCITLILGAVSLHYKNRKGKNLSMPLAPGEQARINRLNGRVEIENIDTGYYIAWKDGIYRFTNEPLEKIVSLLAKRFDLDIYIAPSLKNKRFTGRVIQGEDIEDVLNSIGKSYPIKYRITGERINIIE